MDTTNPGMSRKLMKPSGMISEDHSAMANMPQGVVMKEYPKTPMADLMGYKDNITGIDERLSHDSKKMKGHQSKELQ
jgi:hypothetical protein